MALQQQSIELVYTSDTPFVELDRKKLGVCISIGLPSSEII